MSQNQSNQIRQTKPAHIRWIIRRDLDEVLKIEEDSFDFPWDEETLIRCLRQKNTVGIVAECDDRVVGYMIYEIRRSEISLINIAVHPEFRRRGIGQEFVRNLNEKLSLKKGRRITLIVNEYNLNAHLFFQNMGFVATDVIHDFYDELEADAYRMVYTSKNDS